MLSIFLIDDFERKNIFERLILSIPLMYCIIEGMKTFELVLVAIFMHGSFPIVAEKKMTKKFYWYTINLVLLVANKFMHFTAREYLFYADKTWGLRKIYRSVFDRRYYVINSSIYLIYFIKLVFWCIVLFLTNSILLLLHVF